MLNKKYMVSVFICWYPHWLTHNYFLGRLEIHIYLLVYYLYLLLECELQQSKELVYYIHSISLVYSWKLNKGMLIK